ncbi:MAG: hypothetical protein WCK08_10760 [Betaproteobacteria bacterium]
MVTMEKGVGVREDDLPWVDIAVRPGYQQRYHGFYDSSKRLALRIGSLYADPYYMSPSHRHTFQQVRFLVEGKMRYNKDIYNAGDCLYIPEGAYYGPITPVAKKDGGSEKMHFVDMQFEGPSGIPYPHPDAVVASQRALATTGKFEEGIYTFADGHKRDAYEAILEHLTGQPVKYPPSRLDSYVVMRTASYPWVPMDRFAGITQRHLGYFFECGPNVKMFSMKAGATLPAGAPNGHRALFLLSGSINFDGEAFDAFSYFVMPDATPYGAIKAETDTQMLAIGWNSPGHTVPFELF